jgi:sugar phosphate isomerase/epimerase
MLGLPKENFGMRIGCMIWRIGDILDFYDQIEWVKTYEFEEVSFWTIPGQPGHWQGFDAEHATQHDVVMLKKALTGISEVDLHAGFPMDSANQDTRRANLQKLTPTFKMAGEIGASVVTIHADARAPEFCGRTRDSAMAESLTQLNELAKEYDVLVGIETEWDMPLIERLELPRVGITLDTGHMYFNEGAAFKPYGSLGGLIERFRKKIFHLHVHDYDGNFDHIGIGKGHIDFPDIIRALCNIQFKGSLCLEINPDREPPEAICQSRDRLREMIRSNLH